MEIPDYKEILKNAPKLSKRALRYVFEDLQLEHIPNTLWIEFGVYSGESINYISNFTQNKVYGFDSFYGLPEDWRDGFQKGFFNKNGELPKVNDNVTLIKGLFQDTLDDFIQKNNNLISFLHMDADLYSATKYVLNTLKNRLSKNCVIVFDEIVNYDGYDKNNGELRALYEFVNENSINFEWIGIETYSCHNNESAAIKINI